MVVHGKIIRLVDQMTLTSSFEDEMPEGDDIVDRLYQQGNPTLALLFSSLFVPKFSLQEDYVLLDDGRFSFPDDYLKARLRWDGSVIELVDSFNWRDMATLFHNSAADRSVYDRLASVVADAWSARLAISYPTRKFRVEVLSPDVTGDGVGVGFKEL